MGYWSQLESDGKLYGLVAVGKRKGSKHHTKVPNILKSRKRKKNKKFKKKMKPYDSSNFLNDVEFILSQPIRKSAFTFISSIKIDYDEFGSLTPRQFNVFRKILSETKDKAKKRRA